MDLPPPHAFLSTILPLLFSPDPLPLAPSLLSQPAKQAIHYLSLSPDDVEYWALGKDDDGVSERRRAVIEAGNLEDLQLGDAQYSFDFEEIKALVSISLPYPSSSTAGRIGVILLWEEQASPAAAATTGGAGDEEPDEGRPGWAFLRLEALPVEGQEASSKGRRPTWYPTVGQAIDASTSALSRALAPSRASPPPPLDFSGQSGNETYSASHPTQFGNGDAKKFKSAEEMAEGEGTTPGAYGAAEDFWAGWSDEEGDDGTAEAIGAAEKDNDEAEYWAAYAQVGDGPDTREPVEVSRPVSSVYGGLAETTTTERLSPAPAQGDADRPKTRSRRSSTVTPASISAAMTALSASQSQPSGPLYYSSTLPPLSPSHFGISPTQRGGDVFDYSAPSASVYSTDTVLIEPRLGSPPLDSSASPPDVAKTLPSFPLVPPEIKPATPTPASYASAPHPPPSPTKELPPVPTQVAFHSLSLSSEAGHTSVLQQGHWSNAYPPSFVQELEGLSRSIEAPSPVPGEERAVARGAGDDNLRFALAGLWGLYSAGAKGREEMEESRRRFERIAAEVVRS
ncbi:hypothetical protein JCM1840_004682 [Sporobolomyces johnsonii]